MTDDETLEALLNLAWQHEHRETPVQNLERRQASREEAFQPSNVQKPALE